MTTSPRVYKPKELRFVKEKKKKGKETKRDDEHMRENLEFFIYIDHTTYHITHV